MDARTPWIGSILLHLTVLAGTAAIVDSVLPPAAIRTPSLTWLGTESFKQVSRRRMHARPPQTERVSQLSEKSPPSHLVENVPDTGSSSGSRTELARVGERIRRELKYPEDLLDRGVEGDLAIRLSVHPSGEIMSAEVGRSSGFVAFDKEAIRSLRAAAPFPELAAISRRVILPVRFEIPR